MMPTLGRLKRRPEFLKVASARSKWVTPGLILQARCRPSGERGAPGGPVTGKSEEAELVRVGFTVSRKVGNATRRNRARRRLRAAAAEVLPEHGRPGYDYVLVGRSETLDRPYAELVGDLRTALRHVTKDRERARKPAVSAARGGGGA